MDTNLQPIVDALAELTDDELQTLIASVAQSPQLPPGLLAWIEHAADWELLRRQHREILLQPPEAAIDPSEEPASLGAMMMLRDLFATDAPAVAALFDAVARVMTGTGASRH